MKNTRMDSSGPWNFFCKQEGLTIEIALSGFLSVFFF